MIIIVSTITIITILSSIGIFDVLIEIIKKKEKKMSIADFKVGSR